MNEADMERLIRDHPEEFFDEPLKLVSEQESLPSGVADLIFEDGQGDLVVMELKRGTLLREHVAQVLDYLGDVEDRYRGKNVELMVVANIIPAQRRTKLGRLGVTFKEIPEKRFREVAAKHGVQLSEQGGPPGAASHGALASIVASERVSVRRDCPRSEVASLLSELISYGERWVVNFGKALKEDLENSGYEWLSRRTYAQLSRWCFPERWSSREQWVQPRAHRISQLLFGRVIERQSDPY